MDERTVVGIPDIAQRLGAKVIEPFGRDVLGEHGPATLLTHGPRGGKREIAEWVVGNLECQYEWVEGLHDYELDILPALNCRSALCTQS